LGSFSTDSADIVSRCPVCPKSDALDGNAMDWRSVEAGTRIVIQASKMRTRIMRYELTDHEWTAIRPMLPNKPRGVPRVNDRRVLNGIFWVLRSGAPWRDLPDDFGPYTTCYNRFVRWRRAGVWTRIMNALAAAHDASVQMIDTSIVRVHQHGACIIRNRRQSMGRSRGGLTSKIHAVVDTNGLPIRLALTAGEAHDNRLADKMLSRLKSGTMLLADRGYDADWIRALAAERGGWANIPHDAIATIPSASARISTVLGTWSSGSSTRSSTVAGLQRATTSWRRITSLSSSLRRSGYGCALMSPRPSTTLADFERRGIPESVFQ
jgi:transposase